MLFPENQEKQKDIDDISSEEESEKEKDTDTESSESQLLPSEVFKPKQQTPEDITHQENKAKLRECLTIMRELFFVYTSFLTRSKAIMPKEKIKKVIKWTDVLELFHSSEMFDKCFAILNTAAVKPEFYELLDIDLLSIKIYKVNMMIIRKD